MAAKTLDEILGSLSADEKKLFENTLSKNPDLKAGWMAQADYSRKTQELAAEKAKLQDDLDYAEQMKSWAEVNVPRYDALVEKGIIDKETGEELWTAQKSELESQLAAARAAGGDMDPAELKKNVEAIVKEYGVTSPEEMKALIAAEGKKLAAEEFTTQWSTKEKDFNEKTIPFVAGFSSGVAVVAAKYEAETGQPWTSETAKEFFAMMSKENNFDPYAVKDTFLKPFKDKKDAAAEVERLAQEKADEIIKQRSGLPGTGGETYIPGQEKGNLQAMLERSAGDNDFESVIRAKAVESAKELAAAGK
jgi:hypothetical protein